MDGYNIAPLNTVDGFEALVAELQPLTPAIRDVATVHVPMGLAWSLEAFKAAMRAGWLLQRVRTARRWGIRARCAIDSTARTLLRFAVGLALAEQPGAHASLCGTPVYWRSRALVLAATLPAGMWLAGTHEDLATFDALAFDESAERMQRFAAAVAASPSAELLPDDLERIAEQMEPRETQPNGARAHEFKTAKCSDAREPQPTRAVNGPGWLDPFNHGRIDPTTPLAVGRAALESRFREQRSNATMIEKPTKPTTEATASRDDAQRVADAVRTFGVRALAADAGVSIGAVTRVAAGTAVKRATLTVVIAAADRMSAARARKLQHSDTRGAL